MVGQVSDYALAEFLAALWRSGRLGMLFQRGEPDLFTAIQWLATRPIVRYETDESGRILGIGFVVDVLGPGKAEVAFAFIPEAPVWRVIKVLRRWISEALASGEIDILYVSIPKSNLAGRAVALRLGFRFISLIPSIANWRGEDDDMLIGWIRRTQPSE